MGSGASARKSDKDDESEEGEMVVPQAALDVIGFWREPLTTLIVVVVPATDGKRLRYTCWDRDNPAASYTSSHRS